MPTHCGDTEWTYATSGVSALLAIVLCVVGDRLMAARVAAKAGAQREARQHDPQASFRYTSTSWAQEPDPSRATYASTAGPDDHLLPSRASALAVGDVVADRHWMLYHLTCLFALGRLVDAAVLAFLPRAFTCGNIGSDTVWQDLTAFPPTVAYLAACLLFLCSFLRFRWDPSADVAPLWRHHEAYLVAATVAVVAATQAAELALDLSGVTHIKVTQYFHGVLTGGLSAGFVFALVAVTRHTWREQRRAIAKAVFAACLLFSLSLMVRCVAGWPQLQQRYADDVGGPAMYVAVCVVDSFAFVAAFVALRYAASHQ